MSADIVSEFLTALRRSEPDAGYLSAWDEPTARDDEEYVPTVGIDGWLRRADLERILTGIYDAGRESAAKDLEVEAAEVEKQFPGGRASAVLFHAVRLVREGRIG
ncbi:hypothetical protein [Microbacterium sp. Root280D1]|uniref:hypothetical protein n=1 Tax=Microbacterium sp. Root280D1 TaxID=1736510 RepID=UPI0006FA5406|nr:hypothetical protein [Microbacterium sp. Root280D1]KRD51974.1 hypothetical protein ASE34_08640 [Microbacterium sp. Root280D1]